MSDEAPRFAFVLACRGRAKPANLAAVLLLGLGVAVAPAARGESSVRFSPISLPLETYHVYDLLVADLNADGILDVSDPVTILAWLFLGNDIGFCPIAADGNDDGSLNVSDVIYILNAFFLGGLPPSAPWPDCGPDPTPDLLRCYDYPCP